LNLPPGYDPQKDRIKIEPYNPKWPALFQQEKEALKQALGGFQGLRIEHFGSTAVPGLAAKPILDILAGVSSKEDWPRMIRPLAVLGYVQVPGAFDDAIRWFFVKGMPLFYGTNHNNEAAIAPNSFNTDKENRRMPPYGEKRTHHLHVCELESEEWRRELAFRDYLRAHADTVKKYESLKKELATKFATDREAYTEAKTEFIQEILRKL
jgi:GrpB-like predicted nucleotidyltransferase (UPF0157 family)